MIVAYTAGSPGFLTILEYIRLFPLSCDSSLGLATLKPVQIMIVVLLLTGKISHVMDTDVHSRLH